MEIQVCRRFSHRFNNNNKSNTQKERQSVTGTKFEIQMTTCLNCVTRQVGGGGGARVNSFHYPSVVERFVGWLRNLGGSNLRPYVNERLPSRRYGGDRVSCL
jgi:hypothetical protein